MYIKNGICYADDPTPLLHVVSATPVSDGNLFVEFDNGESRIFNKKLLQGPVFEPLNDEATYASVFIDHGVMTWCNGTIDVAPEYVLNHGDKITQ